MMAMRQVGNMLTAYLNIINKYNLTQYDNIQTGESKKYGICSSN